MNLHSKQWATLVSRLQNNTLPHALIFYGEEGIGKQQFAIDFSNYLLCENQYNGSKCGQCKSCKLIQAHSHPDLIILEPEEKSTTIKVAQIRELTTRLHQTSQNHGHQIAIINPADAMNIAAYNSLLKTLEEPAGQVLIILTTSKLSLLPATIRSRCQLLQFCPKDNISPDKWMIAKLEEDASQNYAALFHDLSELCINSCDIIAFANKWHTANSESVLDYWYLYCLDILKTKQQVPKEMLSLTTRHMQLSKVASLLSINRLLNFIDQLTSAKKCLRNNLNTQLLLEQLAHNFNRAKV